VDNFGASACYLPFFFCITSTTHPSTCGMDSQVMAHLPALGGKTKQFHQLTSRKYSSWNNLSHGIALQNQPLCKRILCFRKEFHHLKVHRHGGRHHPPIPPSCWSSINSAGMPPESHCNRVQTLTLLFILFILHCNDTRKPP
jgi:hypothetical protein